MVTAAPRDHSASMPLTFCTIGRPGSQPPIPQGPCNQERIEISCGSVPYHINPGEPNQILLIFSADSLSNQELSAFGSFWVFSASVGCWIITLAIQLRETLLPSPAKQNLHSNVDTNCNSTADQTSPPLRSNGEWQVGISPGAQFSACEVDTSLCAPRGQHHASP